MLDLNTAIAMVKVLEMTINAAAASLQLMGSRTLKISMQGLKMMSGHSITI